MNRYSQLIPLIEQVKPKHIVEVGTWNGLRAMMMAEEALKHQESVHYSGFDLFEEATDQTDADELNVKAHFSGKDVADRLEKFAEANPGFSWELFAGNSRETLPNFKFEPEETFAFIDGGHSIETIRSDFSCLEKAKMVVLDDFYEPDERGCPDLTKFGCNAVLEGRKFHLLQTKDPVKDGGTVQMAAIGEVKKKMKVKTKNCVPDAKIHANIRYFATLVDRWVKECNPHDGVALICSGGPSLMDHLDEIRKLSKKKLNKVVCVKHSHDKLIDAGIVPWGCLLLDPRSHTKDFIEHPHKDVTYLAASMVHPSTLDKLLENEANVWGYNALVGAGEDKVLVSVLNESAILIPGGSTAAMRGVNVLHTLGFRKFRLYGFDSSYKEDVGTNCSGKTQKECIEVEVGGEKFYTDPELIAQMQDFQDIFNQARLDIEVIGEGLIPHVYQLLRKKKAEFMELFDAS